MINGTTEARADHLTLTSPQIMREEESSQRLRVGPAPPLQPSPHPVQQVWLPQALDPLASAEVTAGICQSGQAAT